MSRHDFGAHYRNGAESAAGGEPKKKGAAFVPNALFLDRFEPKLEALVELKAAKTHTRIYKVNRHEFYCAVELPLSDYPLYGKQLVANHR